MNKITFKINLKTPEFISDGFLQITDKLEIKVLLTFDKGQGTYTDGILNLILLKKRPVIGSGIEWGRVVHFIEGYEYSSDKFIINMGDPLYYPFKYYFKEKEDMDSYLELKERVYNEQQIKYFETEYEKEEGRY